MPTPRMIRPTLILLAITAMPAAELVVRDLRLGMATRLLAFDFTTESRAGQRSGVDAFQAGLGLELGGRWSYARAGDAVGLVVGADVMLDAWTNEGGGGMAATWLRASVGPAWAISDDWTMMAEIGMLYGASGIKLPATTQTPEFTATGTASGYDLRIKADWLASRSFGIGGHVGWQLTSHDLKGDSVDLTIKQAGLFFGLEAIWRFSDVPSRLE